MDPTIIIMLFWVVVGVSGLIFNPFATIQQELDKCAIPEGDNYIIQRFIVKNMDTCIFCICFVISFIIVGVCYITSYLHDAYISKKKD